MRQSTLRKFFGARVRQLRVEQGLSASDLAALMDRHRTFVCHFELGTNGTTLDTVSRIAEVLAVDEKDLLTFPELSLRDVVIDLTRKASRDALIEAREILLQSVREQEQKQEVKEKRLSQRTGAKTG